MSHFTFSSRKEAERFRDHLVEKNCMRFLKDLSSAKNEGAVLELQGLFGSTQGFLEYKHGAPYWVMQMRKRL